MSIITKMRKQTAVYWAPATPDGFGGKTFDDPIEIDCRWEDELKKVTNISGEEVVSKSTVYVDRELEIGGYLFLGTLDDIPDGFSGSPDKLTTAFPILSFAKLPNLKNTETLYTAYL